MALGLLARSRALLARDQEAEVLYSEKPSTEPPRCPSATDPAPTHLLYGEWLRRRKRRAEARYDPRAASAQFEAMGAAAFA